ncbi:MAG: M28 family metallopeptidase [Candidatus Geothermincolia bacterium]
MSAFKHLEYLVNHCGDRRIGTRGNAMAADYIVSTLESAGYECHRESFSGPPGVHAPNALAMGIGAVASKLMSATGRVTQALGFMLGMLMAAIMLGVETTRRSPSRAFFRRARGSNIIARAGTGPPRVVLVAHYDTINQSEAFRPARVHLVPFGSYVQALFPVLTIALGPLHRKLPGRLLRAALFAGSMSMLQWQFAGGYNAGANDNGSGVAAALECAIATGSRRSASDGFWFLFTDGEEAALAGMTAFCEEHRADLEGAVILNLESVGRGSLKCVGRESMLVPRRPPAWLLAEVVEVADRTGVRLEVEPGRTFATDAVAALARGLPAVTLAGLDGRGLVEGWHFDDLLENIDPGLLEETASLAAVLLAHLSSRRPDFQAGD